MCLAIIRERGEAHQNDAGELIGVEVVGRAAVEVANGVGKDSCRAGVLERTVQGHVDHGVARVEYGAVVGDGGPADREGERCAVPFSSLDTGDEVLEFVDVLKIVGMMRWFVRHDLPLRLWW